MSVHSIYGIGNPLMDLVVYGSHQLVQSLGARPGTMNLVDERQRDSLLAGVEVTGMIPGGSCANTLRGIAWLAGDGGERPLYAGGVGRDALGDQYEEQLRGLGVETRIARKDRGTGVSTIIVTPDHERTMFTCLGASQELSASDCAPFPDTRMLYFTGYMWDTVPQKNAVLKALKECKKNGGTVAFDLADPFAVNRNRDEFVDLIKENADIVFANREEATLLFGTGTADEAVSALSQICGLAVVKDGRAGSLVKRAGHEIERVPVRRIKAVDTTGAGDMYAAGFLYGVISGMSDRESGICASYLASRVVETWGAQFAPESRAGVAGEVARGEWQFTA